MSSTKNVKGNRMAISAAYTMEDYYALPDGLDLKNKKIVKSWYIKWRRLTIEMVDGTELEIGPTIEGEIDFKYSNKEELVNLEKEEGNDYIIENLYPDDDE